MQKPDESTRLEPHLHILVKDRTLYDERGVFVQSHQGSIGWPVPWRLEEPFSGCSGVATVSSTSSHQWESDHTQYRKSTGPGEFGVCSNHQRSVDRAVLREAVSFFTSLSEMSGLFVFTSSLVSARSYDSSSAWLTLLCCDASEDCSSYGSMCLLQSYLLAK